MDLLGNDYPFVSTALEGKHAFVCGASKGIGEATAKMLAKAGADVTICARNGAALTALCEELGRIGSGRHQALMLDLEETDSIASAFASARAASLSACMVASMEARNSEASASAASIAA